MEKENQLALSELKKKIFLFFVLGIDSCSIWLIKTFIFNCRIFNHR